MNGKTLVAALAVLLTLQGATFAWVVKVESRLTRLETIIELAFKQAQ